MAAATARGLGCGELLLVYDFQKLFRGSQTVIGMIGHSALRPLQLIPRSLSVQPVIEWFDFFPEGRCHSMRCVDILG